MCSDWYGVGCSTTNNITYVISELLLPSNGLTLSDSDADINFLWRNEPDGSGSLKGLQFLDLSSNNYLVRVLSIQ
jgi:hypothetical protein